MVIFQDFIFLYIFNAKNLHFQSIKINLFLKVKNNLRFKNILKLYYFFSIYYKSQ